MSDALEEVFGFAACLFQWRCLTGIIDAYIAASIDHPRTIIEIKRTLSVDAYDQLQRYASAFTTPLARVIIAKSCGPVAFPEPPTFLRTLSDLKALAPGFYVLPCNPKGRNK